MATKKRKAQEWKTIGFKLRPAHEKKFRTIFEKTGLTQAEWFRRKIDEDYAQVTSA